MKISVIVKTNSKESKVEVKDNIYYVYTKSPARENKANIELIKLMAEYLNIPEKDICIKRGNKSKKNIGNCIIVFYYKLIDIFNIFIYMVGRPLNIYVSVMQGIVGYSNLPPLLLPSGCRNY